MRVIRLKTHTKSSRCLYECPVRSVSARSRCQKQQLRLSGDPEFWFALSKENTHVAPLAAFENLIDVEQIGLVVDDGSLHLNPSVGLEWNQLSSNDQLCTPPVSSKQ